MPDPLSTTFSALADPTRRAILARLASGDAPVPAMAAVPVGGGAAPRRRRLDRALPTLLGREPGSARHVSEGGPGRKETWTQEIATLTQPCEEQFIWHKRQPTPPSGNSCLPELSMRRASSCSGCGPTPSIWRNGGGRETSP